jgi:hypothetical protein
MANEKEHVERIKKSKFNRQRAETRTLRANCTSGYMFEHEGTAAGQSEFHHVLAISSLQDGNIRPEDKLDFYHNCMAMTTWDINDGPNLMGMPVKAIFENAERQPLTDVVSLIHEQFPGMAIVDAQLGAFGSLPDLPCHDNEHNDYNTEQVKDLRANIWEPLEEVQEDCSINGKDILAELERATLAWRQFLIARGKECGGAAHCWRNRNEPGYNEFWYIPFSMNPGTPLKAMPPPDLRDRPSTIANWLSTLFNTVT